MRPPPHPPDLPAAYSEVLPSFLADDIENVVGTIEAGAEFSFSFDIHGLLPGEQQLVAGLDSDQVEMVSGEAEVLVVEGVEETDSPWQPEVEVLSVDLNLATNRRVSSTDTHTHLSGYCP